MAERIQRQRVKGWRMPPNTIYVGRPSEWGNDFTANWGTPAERVELYKRYFIRPTLQIHGRAYFEPLRGKSLACWCRPDQPCHADALLEIANS